MCDMSLRMDPTRTSTREVIQRQVVERVNTITYFKLKANWWFGKEPYCRNNPAPAV